MVGVMLAATTPLMAQSSELLASAERLALELEAEQDETFVRRRRSGTMGTIGGVLAAAGLILALRSPSCELVGGGPTDSFTDSSFDDIALTLTIDRRFEALLGPSGDCDVRQVGSATWDFSGSVFADFYLEAEALVDRQRVQYLSDARLHNLDEQFNFLGREAETDRTMNYVGWAAVGVGGVLLWLGLTPVEVPFRVDMTPGRGFRASRSFGW